MLRRRSLPLCAIRHARTALGGLSLTLLLSFRRCDFLRKPVWLAATLHVALLTLLAVFVVFLTPVGLSVVSTASDGTSCEQWLLLPSMQIGAVELPATVVAADPGGAAAHWLALDGSGMPLSSAYPAVLIAPLMAVSARQVKRVCSGPRRQSGLVGLACKH
jgi:hypothetical protein